MDNSKKIVSVQQWLEVLDPGGSALSQTDWEEQRLKRLHGLQIAQDVIAQIQNIPLRLLRTRNLGRLGEVLKAFVTKWHTDVISIIIDVSERHPLLDPHDDAGARKVILQLQDASLLETLRDWIVSLATEQPEGRPSELPTNYETWVIELLPHLERDIWLTEMSNPHPAHGLARMVEHWSLFVLMWAWKHMQTSSTVVQPAFGVARLGLMLIPAFGRRGRSPTQPPEGDDVTLLVGPFELERPNLDEGAEADSAADAGWFDKPFRRYLDNAASAVSLWWDVQEKAPGRTELLDAFATRSPLPAEDAMRRARDSAEALKMMLAARLHPSLIPSTDIARPMSRANWESIATFSAWFHRWVRVLSVPAAELRCRFHIGNHRVAMQICWSTDEQRSGGDLLMIDRNEPLPRDAVDEVNLISLARGIDERIWIELPSALLARARERQHAMWTSHSVAIHNLLTRHSRPDRPIGPDRGDELPNSGSCDEVDFLLRGYGGRVCQYLLQMARAEVAFIVWLDYSGPHPKVRHVGGADRLVQHRAQRRERFASFIHWAHEIAQEGGLTPAESGANSHSQIYRSIAAAAIDPHSHKFDPEADAAERQRRQAHFDHYAGPTPEDGTAIPLLFNGRVVGAFFIAGVASTRHFDDRLNAPLRRVAQLLAQAMAKQSQLWQMRRLNWLASHRPLELWSRHDAENQFNPLGPVARILANVFLCPVVHTWLRDPQNPKRYRLHGYTRAELFSSADAPMQSAPQFRLNAPAAPDETVPLNRQFIAFACDQWLHSDSDAKAGAYVQARLGVVPSTLPEYTVRNASRGGLRLGQDFVEANEPSGLRQTLFVKGQLFQIMAFALVDTSAEVPEPIGIVSLHAPIPSYDGHHLPWPPGWRQVVGHMQTYIPYVLTQTEAIGNPLENLRRYLLHEGRNELNEVAAKGNLLRGALNHLLAPDSPAGQRRPWLRTTARELRARGKDNSLGSDAGWANDLANELLRFERQLADAWPSFEEVSSPRHAENLQTLARLITHQRDLAALGGGPDETRYDHETNWVVLRDKLDTALSVYESVWKDEGIWIDLDGVPRGLKLLVSPWLLDWLLRDLVHNLAKYALRNEPITISWHRGHGDERSVLRFRNVSSFDAEQDTCERLVLFGVQGSAGLKPPRKISQRAGIGQQGQGIGLWGTSALTEVLDMPLTIQIRQRPDLRTANYVFEFQVARRLVE
jgi:hypothetical protein